MFDRIKKDFSTITWVLIPVAIAINSVVGWIVAQLKLPVYLDSIGTVFIAAVAGPWVGALTGALTNIILGFFDPNFLPWWPVAFFIGLVAGLCASAGLFKSWWKVVITGFLIAITAALASTPIAMSVYGGITPSGSSLITAYLVQTGQEMWKAVFSTNFLVEPIDKITTAMTAFAIVMGLSRRFLARLPRAENVEIEEGASRTQLYIAIGVIVLLIAFAGFFLSRILGG
jgi:energy-coupling factor transport system substrate-specific component